MAAYTKEETQTIVEIYTKAVDKEAAIQQVMQMLGKPKRSVVAKLAAEGCYLGKTREARVKKAVYIKQIADVLGIDEALLDSLEKANILAIRAIAEKLE